MTTKVLIIECNSTNLGMIEDIFTDDEFDVDQVHSSEAALQKIKEADTPYNLVIASIEGLDNKPEIFSLNLRTNEDYFHTPLILITKYNSEADDSYYAVGYTQVYSLKEYGTFRNYILQRLSQKILTKSSKHSALLIEDDRSQQVVIESLLGEIHCETHCFRSAEEALEKQDSLSPDIIIVDFFLAGKMTGMKFINEVKTPNHPWHQIPIIALTGIDDPARRYELLRAGANDYLVKPLQKIDVSVRVENLLKYKKLLDTVEQQREEMHYLAMHDQLTGLHNRHFMASQVSGRIKEAIRHNIDYSIIMMDIDNFKKVNDTYGHDKGDQTLIDIAKILKENSRNEDFIVRLGGEEFILLLSYCNLSNAISKAEHLRKSIESSRPGDIDITASFGVAQLSSSLQTFEKLFKSADEAVYRAKNKGRNRVETGTPPLSINND